MGWGDEGWYGCVRGHSDPLVRTQGCQPLPQEDFIECTQSSSLGLWIPPGVWRQTVVLNEGLQCGPPAPSTARETVGPAASLGHLAAWAVFPRWAWSPCCSSRRALLDGTRLCWATAHLARASCHVARAAPTPEQLRCPPSPSDTGDPETPLSHQTPPGRLSSDHSRRGNEESGQNAYNFLHVSDGCFLKWLGCFLTWFIEKSQFSRFIKSIR